MRIRTFVLLALGLAFPALAAMPDLNPPPKRIIAGEAVSLPASWRLQLLSACLPEDDPGVARLREVMSSRSIVEGDAFTVRVGLLNDSTDLRKELQTVSTTDHLPDNREAFFIHVTRAGASVGGRSPRALCYGLETLAQWLGASTGSIESGWVLDWPSLSQRSYMIDSSRLMEKKDYYRKMLRLLSQWRYNVMLMHMIDYPGITLRFDSHPEPADPNAWTPEEIRDLHALAARYHIDLMPEVELFGHAGGWTRHPQYRALGEGRNGSSFNPLNPDTSRLTADLVRETASLFPFPLFHAGLDEVNSPTSPEGRAYVKAHGMNRWLTDYIQNVYTQIKAQHKRMAMWGDMLYKRMGTAYAIPRDTIIYDWHYYTQMDGQWDSRGEKLEPPESWSYFRQLGFDVVAAPSLACGSYRIWPDVQRLNNCVGSATEAAAYGLMGVCVTVWAPARYVPDALWYSTAVAGNAAWAGFRYDRASADRGFFRDFYGLDFTKADHAALTFMLDHTPDQQEIWRLLWVSQTYRERFLRTQTGRMFGVLAEAEAARKQWEARLPEVTRHREEYSDFLLVARVLEHLAWRAQHGKAILAGDTALRRECLQRTEAIHHQLVQSWERNRYGDPSQGRLHDPMPNGFLILDFYRAIQALRSGR